MAACLCAKSLSRSIRNLRSSLLDAGITAPLFKLLKDESDEVKGAACATICNIVLGFSYLKKTVLDLGVIPILIGLTQSPEVTLKTNAVWALKNLLYQADRDIKVSVTTQMTFPVFMDLLQDPIEQVQEHAVSLLRNMTCGTVGSIQG